MGQAKQRGTYEQRKALAIKYSEAEAKRKWEEHKVRIAMRPTGTDRATKLRITQIMGLLAGIEGRAN